MNARILLCLLPLVACDGGGPADGQPPAGELRLRLEPVATEGLASPVFLTAPPGDARLFIVEQPGRIRVVENGALRSEPFLTIPDLSSGGERGLLSMAFHPRYAENGLFFVNYTDAEGDTRVERYRVSADRNRADPSSATRVIEIDQPFSNHNGGLVAFGPDGRLYVGMGDGGGGGDPLDAGQDSTTLLGKMLRLDVDGAAPYAIPADNPFAGRAGARPEIWAMGLRNPWRFSWDRAAGLLFVADVGQNRLEEINVVPAGDGGLNYGWNVMEGSDCFEPADGCDRTGLVLPASEYRHADGCSVTGGYVYRGRALPALRGTYFYADFCEGWIRSFRYEDGRATDPRSWDVGDVGNITSFGEDAAGELYVLARDGVFRIAGDAEAR